MPEINAETSMTFHLEIGGGARYDSHWAGVRALCHGRLVVHGSLVAQGTSFARGSRLGEGR